jgi:hypothetical protein
MLLRNHFARLASNFNEEPFHLPLVNIAHEELVAHLAT